jgi:uncharacterized protein YndB with AHSA1/START domain
MRRPDGTEVEAQGEYTLIDPPHRLVMTWAFDDDPSNEQLIELSFSESDGSTTVLLVNSGISTDERRDAPGRGMARVLRRARAGIGRLIRRTRDRMETHFPVRARSTGRPAIG